VGAPSTNKIRGAASVIAEVGCIGPFCNDQKELVRVNDQHEDAMLTSASCGASLARNNDIVDESLSVAGAVSSRMLRLMEETLLYKI